MHGFNTLLNLRGTLLTVDDLPDRHLLYIDNHVDGDAYIIEADYHVYFADQHWHDGGPMNGEDGADGDRAHGSRGSRG